MADTTMAALLDLQRIDTATDQHRHRLAHLPEAAAVSELDAKIASLASRRSATAAALEEVAGRQQALEADLAASEARAKAVSARMYSGQVSASRELQAMAVDLESLKARVSDLEDRVLEVLDEREPLDAALIANEEETLALTGRRQLAETARFEAEASLRVELDRATAARDAALPLLPADLVADYERIRARAGGIGAARLVGDRCDGCHLTLPSMELDRIRHAAPGVVVHCDECGRILLR